MSEVAGREDQQGERERRAKKFMRNLLGLFFAALTLALFLFGSSYLYERGFGDAWYWLSVALLVVIGLIIVVLFGLMMETLEDLRRLKRR